MTDTTTNPRWIALEGAFNVRETGGYPANGGTTRPNVLLRADSLHKLTDADREALLARGLRTVIDLRHASEISVAANIFAQSDTVAYHAVPIFESQPDTSNIDTDLATIYRYMVDECQVGLLKAMQTLAHAPEGAVLVHCSAGKDRTGIVTALALNAVGVPREYVVADYALTTEAMNRLRPQLLANTTLPPETRLHLEKLLSSEPELMAGLLNYLDTHYGGVDAYLTHIGFLPADREVLHARLVQPDQETSNV
jgi:protein-tyrosine phosphatase